MAKIARVVVHPVPLFARKSLPLLKGHILFVFIVVRTVLCTWHSVPALL